MELAERIKEARERLGVTQAELARRVGVTRGAIHLLERGQFDPKPELLKKLSKALGLKEEELFMDAGYLSESHEARRSAGEERLIELYNQLSDEGKALVERQLREVLIPMLGKGKKKLNSRKVSTI